MSTPHLESVDVDVVLNVLERAPVAVHHLTQPVQTRQQFVHLQIRVVETKASSDSTGLDERNILYSSSENTL